MATLRTSAATQVQRCKITLTNVSYTFNTFRVLDLPDDIKDFFVIKYTRPGRMSAGVTCVITITFKPKLPDDIETTLPMMSHTGPFSIPLLCYSKKAKPEVSEQVPNRVVATVGACGRRMSVCVRAGSCVRRSESAHCWELCVRDLRQGRRVWSPGCTPRACDTACCLP